VDMAAASASFRNSPIASSLSRLLDPGCGDCALLHMRCATQIL